MNALPLSAVHAQLYDLERDAAFDGLALLSQPDFTKTALTDLLQQLVTPEHLRWRFSHAGIGR